MKGLFLQILNMSASAIWLILAVLLIRFAMQKLNAPKNLRYILWAFVAIRLICPFSIESAMSLLPRQELLPVEFQVSKEDQVDSLIEFKEEEKIEYEHISGIENIVLKPNDENISGGGAFLSDPESTVGYNGVITGTPQDSTINDNFNSTNDTPTSDDSLNWTSVLSWIWTVGVVGLFLYGIISYVNLYKKVQASIDTEYNVWMCDAISGPFLLGIFNPRIYMPSDIKEEQIPYIIAHEKEHIKYFDYIWKPLGFVILAMHWFNPFVWMAYTLMCKDIEYACDERVIRDMDSVQKKAYMESLLCCSSPRHYISACPVAFGETSIKDRIKNVVDYKKPAVWIVGIGIIACVIIAVCFMTNPPSEVEKPTNPNGIDGVDENVIQGGAPGDDVNDDTIYLPYVENKVLFETTADLNHDSIEDLVQTVLTYHPTDEVVGDDVTHPANSVFIRIYFGIREGEYEESAVSTDIVSMSHNANGTFVLTQKDGLDYLIFSNMYQMQGEADYQYKVYYLDEDGSELVVKSDLVSFICDPWNINWEEGVHREDVIPTFKEGLENWLSETSLILISFDVSEETYYTAENCVIPASMYYEKVWERNEDEVLEEYEAVLGEEWQQYIYNYKYHEYDDIYWINEQLESDFSEWYTMYDGSKLQRVVSADPSQAAYGPSVNLDIMYYQADESEDVQDVLYKMFEAMLVARMEPEEGRPYMITDYVVGDTPVVQISERMWLVKYLSGYYKYEGTDLVTYEEALAWYEEEHIVDECIPIMMQGSDDNFWYLLMEEDGVYRLQRYGNMVPETY